MSELTYEWNSRDCDLDEYKNGKYTTCYSGQDIADEMNDYRRALTNSNNRTKALERQLAIARDLLLQVQDHMSQLSSHTHDGWSGSCADTVYEMIENKLKEQG